MTETARTAMPPHVTPCINAIGTAVPRNDVHASFIAWAQNQIPEERDRRLFTRMVARSGIGHRWSVLPADALSAESGFYAGRWPSTGERMEIYAREAPELALSAIRALAEKTALGGITHLVVASCTGFVAPGIDQIIAARLNLSPGVERLLVGYMGCYAAIAALRSARHIVRSEPDARVLVVCVELSSLHLQRDMMLEPLLAMLQFGDGAAAALVTGERRGLAIGAPFATTLAGSSDLIRWTIGDEGFAMHLSGEVPGAILSALGDPARRGALLPVPVDAIDGWAVHAGGRSILNAVEQGLGLDDDALDNSRRVLAENGNMSSATLMFVLEHVLAGPPVREGVALAFGPGVAMEGFSYATVSGSVLSSHDLWVQEELA
ncbi:type III polyketide synthase [Sphingobium subterraneum]|uniref:Putative naringenin-chalcone synthase n=1 Tax=Sphingobium subterraneum TaxID=627688 RepID=A0A841IZL5_9SPHN|nr:type III polyketide synthase [Sphingobium subterraneum]MBB6124103.1 putative naringenin-chalcone synthase [Sphingobium subterraneum]